MKKIIVVDDDPDMRSLISEVLSSTYQVATADNGADGLELIRKERPDLVVLDLLMPRMHGFEVCKHLKEDPATKSIKVLISSSKSYAHDQKTAKAGGADDYIVKPFEVAALKRKVAEMLGLERSAAVKFWGTRGSIPSPGPLTQRYGGNTPCTELRFGDQRVIIDAGSGLRELGASIMQESAGKPVNAHLFIGHTHWDHIQGFPFFTPFYLPQNRFKIYGVHGTTEAFEDVLSGQMNPTYFPVALHEMASRMEICELSGPVDLGGVKVSYHYLNHPGITVGFRFESKDWTVCYISDHEPYAKLNAKGEFSVKEDMAVAQFVHGADVLISEAQYIDEEYRVKKSWGHSTFSDVLGLASSAQVKKLMLFHHDPSHTDAMMDRFMDECRNMASQRQYSFEIAAAMEGNEVPL